jgi:hypothetical protein
MVIVGRNVMTDTARKGLVFETSISVAFDILYAINQMKVWCTVHSCCLTFSPN